MKPQNSAQARPGQPPLLCQDPDPVLTRSSPPGKRILLVDDDSTVRDSLYEVLVTEGYGVIPAGNGLQAVGLSNRLPFDLVLLDLNMPLMNGWDTFEQLTRQHPGLPVIIVTARANQVFTALSAGAGALLEKPVDIPRLLEAVEKLLSESFEQRLARLVGRHTDFYYQAAPASPKKHPQSIARR